MSGSHSEYTTVSVRSDLHRHVTEVTYATVLCMVFPTSSRVQHPSRTRTQGLFIHLVYE